MTSDLIELTDEDIKQLDGISSSFFSNQLEGIGNSAYDVAEYDQINFPTKLSDGEVIAVYRNSKIARNIIDTYPIQASFGSPTFAGTRYKTYGVDPNSLKSYISDSLERADSSSLETIFRQVSISARLLGVAYLVLGFDDGNDYSEPLDESNLLEFKWVIEKSKYELIPDDFLYPTYYSLVNRYSSFNEEKVLESKIHCSRVLKFTGTNDSLEVLRYSYTHDSIFQSCIKDLIRDDRGLDISNQMLMKKAVLWAKLKVAQATTSDGRKNNLQERLRYINLVSSIYRMIGLNTDEELGSNQIDLSNVDKILEANVSRLVAASGLNRFKILGTPSSEGLGGTRAGLENRLDFSQRSHAYSCEFWKPHLMKIFRLFCQVKNSPTSGRLPNGLDVNFPPNLTLFPHEVADLRKTNCEWAQIAVTLGLVSKKEVRQAFFSATDLESQLVPNLILDEQFTSQLMDEYEQIEDTHYLVYFEGRTTPAVVQASSSTEARSKAVKKFDGKYTIKSSRIASEAENKQIANGTWIRTRSDGKSPEKSNQKSTVRPWFFKDSEVELICDSEDEEMILEVEDSGEIFADKALYDTCMAETRAKFSVYPSAYANGYLTKIYKEKYTKKHGSLDGAFNSKTSDSLTNWFKEDWVSIDGEGNITGDCGSGSTQGKVKCLPRAKAERLTKTERSLLAKRKMTQDPNPDRSGSPINVSSKVNDEAIAVDKSIPPKLLAALELLADTSESDLDLTMEELVND